MKITYTDSDYPIFREGQFCVCPENYGDNNGDSVNKNCNMCSPDS